MERDIKVPGIIIRRENAGEGDAVLSVLSSDGSLVRARIYAMKKSAKSPKVPLYSEGVFSLYRRDSSHLSLKDVDIISSHEEILASWKLSILFELFSELIIRALDLDARAYALYASSLDAASLKVRLERIGSVFILHYLRQLGLLGDFISCPSCGKRFLEDEVLGFSHRLGQPVCMACDEAEGARPLPPSARRFMKRCLEREMKEAYSFILSEMMEERIFHYLLRLLSFLPESPNALSIALKEL